MGYNKKRALKWKCARPFFGVEVVGGTGRSGGWKKLFRISEKYRAKTDFVRSVCGFVECDKLRLCHRHRIHRSHTKYQKGTLLPLAHSHTHTQSHSTCRLRRLCFAKKSHYFNELFGVTTWHRGSRRHAMACTHFECLRFQEAKIIAISVIVVVSPWHRNRTKRHIHMRHQTEHTYPSNGRKWAEEVGLSFRVSLRDSK